MNNFVNQLGFSNVTQNPPLNVPSDIDRRVYIAIATNNMPCNTSQCLMEDRIVTIMNNVSFQFPRIDILQAYYNKSTGGVFTEDFPLDPPVFYNFTGDLTPFNQKVELGTRAVVLNYGEAVGIVLEATQPGAGGSHPIHLHSFSFYWVGTGSENFNNVTDPSTYNQVDPPHINTVHVPGRGWVALRFFATNPGLIICGSYKSITYIY
ncbi:hypothetical protein REPUB_Repub05bG0181500 [Reevesia pubescens]